MARRSYQLGWEDRRGVVIWIYGLQDPRDQIIKYVGRSENPWVRVHSHARIGASRRVKAWTRGLIAEGLMPHLVLLRRVEPGEDADIFEYMAIRALRRREDRLLNDFSVEVKARHRRIYGPVAIRRATTARATSTAQKSVAHVAQTTDQVHVPAATVAICGRELPMPNTSHRAKGSALSARQRDVLNAIKAYLLAHGYTPTIRELCALIGVNSTNAIADHLGRLEKKGFISRRSNTPRSIRVLQS